MVNVHLVAHSSPVLISGNCMWPRNYLKEIQPGTPMDCHGTNCVLCAYAWHQKIKSRPISCTALK